MIEISPSMLCADFARLGEVIRELQVAGANRLHFDIMDGHFVPNLTFGPMIMRDLRPLTKLPFEAHLMVKHPESLIELSVECGADLVSVHPESTPHVHRTVQMIRHLHAKAQVAINPGTPIEAIEPLLSEVDSVLVMSVSPGFAGQPFIPASTQRVRELRRMISGRKLKVEIAIDGGIGESNIREVVAAGARMIVAGNSVFGGTRSLKQAIAALKAVAMGKRRG